VDESRWTLAPFGSLADVAPTVLELMGLPQPREMTGRSMLIDALQAKPIPALERLDAA
jgi:2,3-bisphosphoglycerate-independent phosphoglycerate mutase